MTRRWNDDGRRGDATATATAAATVDANVTEEETNNDKEIFKLGKKHPTLGFVSIISCHSDCHTGTRLSHWILKFKTCV